MKDFISFKKKKSALVRLLFFSCKILNRYLIIM